MKVKFFIEETNTGYSAWHEPEDGGIAATTGSTLEELKTNAVESYNLYASDTGKNLVTEADVELVPFQ